MQKIQNKTVCVITHDRTAHPDDLASVALIRKVFGEENVTLYRCREEFDRILADFLKIKLFDYILVVDIGEKYSYFPETIKGSKVWWLDHHQDGFNEPISFPNERGYCPEDGKTEIPIKACAFNLVCRALGVLSPEDILLYKCLSKQFAWTAAVDNGLMPNKIGTLKNPMDFYYKSLTKSLKWTDEDFDNISKNFWSPVLDEAISAYRDKQKALEGVNILTGVATCEKFHNGLVSALSELDDVCFLVHEDLKKEGEINTPWVLRAIPTHPDLPFSKRIPLVSELSFNPKFIHGNGFMGKFKNKDDAIVSAIGHILDFEKKKL